MDELKKPIGSFVIDNTKGIQADDGMYYHYSEVCTLLKKYAQLNDKWISVKDRVPEEDKAVLVTDGKKVMEAYRDAYRYVQGHGYESIEMDNVTHWMLLPEPPNQQP